MDKDSRIKQLEEELFIVKRSLISSLEIQAGNGVECNLSKLEDVLQDKVDVLFVENVKFKEALNFINDIAPAMYEYNDIELKMVLKARAALKNE